MNSTEHPVEQFAMDIVKEFRREMVHFEKRGLREASQIMFSMTDDILAWAQEWLDHQLTLREAAALAECSYSTIQGRVKAGEIPNVGKKGAPRVRRRDVPFKGSHGAEPYDTSPESGPLGPDRDDVGLDLVDLRLISLE